ncbi:hypothetical protein BASA81_010015 [Batrachochytrium salamandrivorans]|nr:hypothetical protein BASA81_010015 [Batrachochytrium salamandrivorans]
MQPRPAVAPPRLGHVMHCTVDRMYEDLLELQTACCTSSDSDRRKKIILYCELQRHRALQLLALHHFAEKESAVVESALQGVDRELLVQWQKNAAAWNPEYAREDMRPYAAWEAVKLFKSVRAPKYDVKTAVNVLVNQKFGGGGGFELLEKNMMDEEEPSADELQDRVLARVLAQELHSCGNGGDGFPAPVDGQITCQSEAYVVKLTLDSKSTWYCTSMRIYVAQPGSEDKLHLSPRWGDILADQLEAFIAKQHTEHQSNVFDSTHKFMTTFCGSLALQILERQANKLPGVQVHTSTMDTLKLALTVPGWFLVIQIENGEGNKFTSKVECEGNDNQLLEVSISLRNLCLVAVVGSAMSQVSKQKLRALRQRVLAHSTRHDASQCRIVTKPQQLEGTAATYQLDLDLFDDSTVLSVRFTDGAFVFSTNSRAVRWGQFTVDEFLSNRSRDVTAAGDSEQAAAVVLALWAEAEAWDCLSLLSNAIQGVYSSPSYVSPSFELVPHISPFPSLFWSLGSFEGLKYVLVCQFKQSPSLFHLKFLPKHKRLLHSVECMVCSIGKGESGEVGVLDLKREPLETLLVTSPSQQQQQLLPTRQEEEGGMDAISALLLEMRERWVKKLFQAKFQLSCGSAAATGTAASELWQGSSLSHIQQFEPFGLEFSNAGLKITGNNQVALMLKRTDQTDVVFDQELRNMVLLNRLAARCELVGTVQQGNQQFVLVWKAPLTGAVRFSVNKETLHLQAFCVPVSHPLEDKLARFCEAHPTDASLDLALSMFSDSTLAIQAAEAYAKRSNRSIRVSASSVTNVHFMFDSTLTEERLSFDCRFFGNSRLVVWNRAGWSHTSPMMGGDVTTVASLQTVLG